MVQHYEHHSTITPFRLHLPGITQWCNFELTSKVRGDRSCKGPHPSGAARKDRKGHTPRCVWLLSITALGYKQKELRINKQTRSEAAAVHTRTHLTPAAVLVELECVQAQCCVFVAHNEVQQQVRLGGNGSHSPEEPVVMELTL